MASTLTPNMVRSWANSLRTLPQYAADAARLDVIAAEIAAGAGGGPPPFVRPEIMQVTVKDYAATPPQGMGRAFGVASGDVQMYGGNKETGSVIDVIHVRALKFVAPAAGHRGALKLGPGAGAQITCINENPGDFRPLLRQNRQHGANQSLTWTTVPGDSAGCPLVPDKTYYINLGRFDYAHYVATSEFRPRLNPHGGSLSGCASGMPCANASFVLGSAQMAAV